MNRVCLKTFQELLLFSLSVASNSLWLHGLQHARLPCSSLSSQACSNSCSLSWWCHPAISSSFTPFSSHPQSFPASGSFPTSRFFKSKISSTKMAQWDLHGDPVVKIPHSQSRGPRVQSLIGELDPAHILQWRSHKPQLRPREVKIINK